MRVKFHRNFKKQYKKLRVKTRKRFEDKLNIFYIDEFSPVLNNHSLKGKQQGMRSINITGDLRAIYKKENQTIVFVAIGSHSSLYK